MAEVLQGKEHALLFAFALSAGLNTDFSSWTPWIRETHHGW